MISQEVEVSHLFTIQIVLNLPTAFDLDLFVELFWNEILEKVNIVWDAIDYIENRRIEITITLIIFLNMDCSYRDRSFSETPERNPLCHYLLNIYLHQVNSLLSWNYRYRFSSKIIIALCASNIVHIFLCQSRPIENIGNHDPWLLSLFFERNGQWFWLRSMQYGMATLQTVASKSSWSQGVFRTPAPDLLRAQTNTIYTNYPLL
jgi:hypothetical protein